jgi:hypothetical protein
MLNDKQRKVRVYEYTTSDYGKGYGIAKNDKAAEKKFGKLNTGTYIDIKTKETKPMSISFYDKVLKGKNRFGL